MDLRICPVLFQKGTILSFYSVAMGTWTELSALIRVDLNEELVCGKLMRSQRTLKQTSQGDSSYTSEPQQQTCTSGSRAFHTNTTTSLCDTISPVSLIDLSENRVCVVTQHEKETAERIGSKGREDEEEVVLGRESGSAGKLLLRADKSWVWK